MFALRRGIPDFSKHYKGFLKSLNHTKVLRIEPDSLPVSFINQELTEIVEKFKRFAKMNFRSIMYGCIIYVRSFI